MLTIIYKLSTQWFYPETLTSKFALRRSNSYLIEFNTNIDHFEFYIFEFYTGK